MSLLRRWRRRRAHKKRARLLMEGVREATNYAQGFAAGEARVSAYMERLAEAIRSDSP